MDFLTIDHWDELVWQKWHDIYEEAFNKNAKPKKVIKNMFRKQMCFFHLLQKESQVYAIALSGKLQGKQILLIDYLAVKEMQQNCGIGRIMVDYIKKWAKENHFESIVIEVEAEDTPKNQARIQFWEKCGFILTHYIHSYKVVPEPYKAMYIKLFPDVKLPDREKEFFKMMTLFHQKSFRGA